MYRKVGKGGQREQNRYLLSVNSDMLTELETKMNLASLNGICFLERLAFDGCSTPRLKS